MNNCIPRITYWNSQRYKQVFDHKLTFRLLDEEVDELYRASTDIDKLDALVDIVYVAIGAMWKLGLSPEQITQAIHVVCDSNDSKEVERVEAFVKANMNKGPNFVPPEPRLQEILNER